MTDFITDWNYIFSFIQGQLIKIGQGINNIADLSGFVLIRQPAYHIQGVIQKMGIYLRLQSFILRTFQFPSHLIIFPEEGVDSGNHKVIILIKRTNFVPVYNIRGFLQYPVFGPLHITAEQINTSGDGMGNRFGEKPGQKQDQKGNTDNNLDE